MIQIKLDVLNLCIIVELFNRYPKRSHDLQKPTGVKQQIGSIKLTKGQNKTRRIGPIII